MIEQLKKRVFLGIEIEAPWPELPKGRCLDPLHRHLTLAFVGAAPLEQLECFLRNFPPPLFQIGFAGRFDKCVVLPKHHPRVCAWQVEWLEDVQALLTYRRQCIDQLITCNLSVDEKKAFYPHVTLCRSPFNALEWKESFSPLPFITKQVHLYESLGHSRYQPIKSYAVLPPFEEVEHTADLAFLVRGHSLNNLYIHAVIALAFVYPPLLHFFEVAEMQSLEEVVILLNRIVTQTDSAIGAPFKAVSFHGKLAAAPEYLEWEMIIDV